MYFACDGCCRLFKNLDEPVHNNSPNSYLRGFLTEAGDKMILFFATNKEVAELGFGPFPIKKCRKCREL